MLETSKLRTKSSIQVNGQVEGDMESQDSIVVGDSGKITGNVKGAFLLVAGHILGNVEVSHQLHLNKSAVINGNVSCESIIIDEGAVLNGNLTMTGTKVIKVKEKQE